MTAVDLMFAPPQNSYVVTLTLNVKVFEGGDVGKSLGLD